MPVGYKFIRFVTNGKCAHEADSIATSDCNTNSLFSAQFQQVCCVWDKHLHDWSCFPVFVVPFVKRPDTDLPLDEWHGAKIFRAHSGQLSSTVGPLIPRQPSLRFDLEQWDTLVLESTAMRMLFLVFTITSATTGWGAEIYTDWRIAMDQRCRI